MEGNKKSIVLYDVGGAIILVFLGIPFGSVIDYLWNLLVLSVALPLLPGDKIKIGKGRRLAYCFFITVLGLIIDWAYLELTWDTYFGGKSPVMIPAMSQAFQLVWLLLPTAMIFLVNAALSYAYLKLERRQAIILGAIIGVFTAPWLLPTLPYVWGWVV
jgi:hypothetical protein